MCVCCCMVASGFAASGSETARHHAATHTNVCELPQAVRIQEEMSPENLQGTGFLSLTSHLGTISENLAFSRGCIENAKGNRMLYYPSWMKKLIVSNLSDESLINKGR